MAERKVFIMGKAMIVACDGQCGKAWGIATRPHRQLSEDVDDVCFLADGELGTAPACNGRWEGGHGKPAGPHEMNKWCTRQCERSITVKPGAEFQLPDWSRRRFNQPWKHAQVDLANSQAAGEPEVHRVG